MLGKVVKISYEIPGSEHDIDSALKRGTYCKRFFAEGNIIVKQENYFEDCGLACAIYLDVHAPRDEFLRNHFERHPEVTCSVSFGEPRLENSLVVARTEDYSETGEFLGETEMYFDRCGEKTRMISYNAFGKFTKDQRMCYDERGVVIAYEYYCEDGTLLERVAIGDLASW